MSALIVDTSSWVLYFKGATFPAIDDALREGRLYLPVVVAAELTSGQISPAKRAALLEFLRELPLADASVEHWFRVGELRLRASRKGLSVSTPDAHIAQSCLELRARLISEDKIFKKLRDVVSPDLALI